MMYRRMFVRVGNKPKYESEFSELVNCKITTTIANKIKTHIVNL